MTLFSDFGDQGLPFLLRWIHFLSGITWIGLLYYFNLVQVPFFAETEAPVRSGAQQKLLPRALWWFRWAAMITFLSGGLYLLEYYLHRRGVRDPGTWVILVGGLPRKDGQSRADLIRANGPIFTGQGRAIDEAERKSLLPQDGFAYRPPKYRRPLLGN